MKTQFCNSQENAALVDQISQWDDVECLMQFPFESVFVIIIPAWSMYLIQMLIWISRP
jgi:hypothetical protein